MTWRSCHAARDNNLVDVFSHFMPEESSAENMSQNANGTFEKGNFLQVKIILILEYGNEYLRYNRSSL